MSESDELLDKWDVKEPQLLKLTVRGHINSCYKRIQQLRAHMWDNLDFEELFGQYFEQFSDEFSNFIAVIGFLQEVGMFSDITYKAIMTEVETIQNDVIGAYKLVYVVPDDEEEENENE